MNEKTLYKECHRLFRYEDGFLIRKINTYRNQRKADEICLNIAPNGYRRVGVNGKSYLQHRIIFLMLNEYMPTEIDHIDMDRLNNLIDNLREVTRSENQYNKVIQNNNTSGFKGVMWHKRKNKWIVNIRRPKGGKVHLGYFSDPIDGAKAYDKMCIEFQGKFARTNKSMNLY